MLGKTVKTVSCIALDVYDKIINASQWNNYDYYGINCCLFNLFTWNICDIRLFPNQVYASGIQQ